MVSETYRKPLRMECHDDHVVRTVRVKCYRFDDSMAADTFFSVPASTRVHGKYVHGYVTSSEGEFYFHSHDACKGRFKK